MPDDVEGFRPRGSIWIRCLGKIGCFISAGAAFGRDGSWNRGNKPLPRMWHLHEGSRKCAFSIGTGENPNPGLVRSVSPPC